MNSLDLTVRRVRATVRTSVNTGSRRTQPNPDSNYGNNNSYVQNVQPVAPAQGSPIAPLVPASSP
ncbi:MAG: hypothetical protein U0174_14400 [Polyangiaceae bacterium]